MTQALPPLDPSFVLAARAGLALLLLSAAWHKLRAQALFRATLAEYRLLPAALVRPAALGLTGLELGLGLAVLLAGGAAALAGAAALLALYAGAMAVNIARGRSDIDCGCTGPAARQPLSAWLVARNGVVAGLALAAAGGAAPRALVWLDWLTVALAVAAASLLYLAANRLIANAPQLETLR